MTVSPIFPSIYDSAILINGPKQFEVNYLIQFLTDRIENVFVIGNGNSSILNLQAQGIYNDSLLKLAKDKKFISKNSKTLVFINAHGGITEDGRHVLGLGINSYYASRNLFDDLKFILDKKLDIIFTACYGRAALKDINELAIGSRILFFSDKDQLSFYANIEMLLIKHFPSNIPLTIDNLFAYYLFNLGSYEKPILAEVRGKIIDPFSFQQNLKGKILTAEAKDFAKVRFSDFCKQDINCTNKSDKAINALTTVSDISTLAKFPNSFQPVIKKISNLLAKNYKVSKSYEILKQCSFHDIELKVEVDNLLNESFIPLSLNLHRVIYESNDELGSNQWPEEFAAQGNDYLFYTTLLQIFCDYNNNFPIPELPLYGSVLLAATFIEEYSEISN